DDPTPLLDVLVGLEEPRHGREVEAGWLTALLTGAGSIRLRCQQADLGPLDLRGEVAHRGAVELHAQPARRLGDSRRLVAHHLGGRAADRLRPEEVELTQR